MLFVYRVEVLEPNGRRAAWFDSVPLLEVKRGPMDQGDRIEGLLPSNVSGFGPGHRVRVSLNDVFFCEATVTSTKPQWGELKTLILDKYVKFEELAYFEAETTPLLDDAWVRLALEGVGLKTAAQALINRALGPAHYTVAHEGFPEGAMREYAKFEARKTTDNELEIGGIAAGQWIGTPRLDVSEAYAKDGKTIAGLKADGAPWPDLRLLMIDAEELTRNAHAVERHPEVAEMTDEEYARSAYAAKAAESQKILQLLIDWMGVSFVELNPHRSIEGAFDCRVDADGRYVGMVFGAEQCLNAAMVEAQAAEVYLSEEGRYLVPEMALKEFYSYVAPAEDSLDVSDERTVTMTADSGLYGALMALNYWAQNCQWGVKGDGAAWFREGNAAHHVIFFEPTELGATWGADATGLVNPLTFSGGEIALPLEKTYAREASAARYGMTAGSLAYFGFASEEDADRLANGLLDDLAYPELSARIVFFFGRNDFEIGELLELRGAPLRRYHAEAEGEWGGRFSGRMIGAVKSITHRIAGRHVKTTVELTSPNRRVKNPLRFIARSQRDEADMYAFALDDALAGLDMRYHLD